MEYNGSMKRLPRMHNQRYFTHYGPGKKNWLYPTFFLLTNVGGVILASLCPFAWAIMTYSPFFFICGMVLFSAPVYVVLFIILLFFEK